MAELRRRNVVEVEYSPLPADPGAPRHPNFYTLNPLPDQEVLRARLRALRAARGPDAVDRAQKIAALVYEDDDLDLVETLLDLERRHGPAALDRAAEILGSKNPDNPKRTAAYLIATIKSLAGEK